MAYFYLLFLISACLLPFYGLRSEEGFRGNWYLQTTKDKMTDDKLTLLVTKNADGASLGFTCENSAILFVYSRKGEYLYNEDGRAQYRIDKNKSSYIQGKFGRGQFASYIDRERIIETIIPDGLGKMLREMLVGKSFIFRADYELSEFSLDGFAESFQTMLDECKFPFASPESDLKEIQNKTDVNNSDISIPKVPVFSPPNFTSPEKILKETAKPE